MPEPRLLLVDGANVLYRAFFAIPNLSTRRGEPTNALFGFIRMFRQLEQQWAPTHRAVILEGGTPARRLALLPEYKANRAPMPEALRSQFALLTQYLERARVPEIHFEGEEADDVIATLAARAGEGEVFMATSDKDALQLVTDRRHVVAPSRAGERIGPAEVRAKCGVDPAQIVDWLALTGDAVDNIAGVPGLGPKTAARLLTRFGSLDALWERLEDVEPERVRLALAEHRARVGRNIALVRLKTDLACELDWDLAATRPESPERLLPFYESLDLHSLAKPLREPTLL